MKNTVKPERLVCKRWIADIEKIKKGKGDEMLSRMTRNILSAVVLSVSCFVSLPAYCAVLPPLQVVTGADPKEGEPLAAQELALYLGKITGTTVPVFSEAETKTNKAPARRLYVGWTDYAKAALKAYRESKDKAPQVISEGMNKLE